MKKIFVSIISRNNASWAMFSAFQNAARYAVENGYAPMLVPHVGDSLVSRARNNALANFLTTDCEYFFTLDDDIAMPPDTMVTLINADKDMIGGFYRLKKNPPRDKEWNLGDMLAFRGMYEFSMKDKEPVEVEYISTGCVMHKRKFIEEMVAHYPELHYFNNADGADRWALYQPFIQDWEYLSEDWAFCRRAINKGYKLYMHPQVKCDHWGLYNYNIQELTNGNSSNDPK